MDYEKAADWLRMHNLPYWKIQAGTRIVARSKGTEEEDAAAGEVKIDASIDFFRENIALLAPGKYTLLAQRKPKGNNGEMTFPFQVQGELPASGATQPAAVAGVGGMDFISGIMDAKLSAQQAYHENQILKIQHAFELDSLRRQLKDVKEGANEDGIGKISNVIQQAITLYNLSKGGAPASLPAVGKSTDQAPTVKHYSETEPTAEQIESEKIALAIGDLHGVFGDDIGNNMASLAAFAKENPEQAKMLLNQLRR